ncbi:MAG: hypothetical protein R3B81_19315 [bacterium]
MRKSLVLATLLVLAVGADALAGVPSPANSSVRLGGQPLACQYRFRADGGLDKMTVFVTLRDAFDVPVANCATSVAATNQTLTLGNCCPAQMTTNILTGNGNTNANGVAHFVVNQLSGRGSADLEVTASCVGNILISTTNFSYTSPDQNASNEAEPASSTNIVDLGAFAACLPPAPYCVTSDFNCDGTVNVIDFGFIGGGLSHGCGAGTCP